MSGVQIELPRSILQRMGDARLEASADLGEGLLAAIWSDNGLSQFQYELPEHHRLAIRANGLGKMWRVKNRRRFRSDNLHALNFVPAGKHTDWLLEGEAAHLHVYMAKSAFARYAEELPHPPSSREMAERNFFIDTGLERLMRLGFLRRSWREPADRVALTEAGYRILGHILGERDEAARPSWFKGGLATGALRRVEEYVRSNLASALTITELASIARLSEFHFARMFKETTGKTPHAYVLLRRIEHAKLLLRTGGLPLSCVASACGFSGQSHFSSQFRKVTGTTPTLYRNAKRG